jgi:calmodulin
MGGKIIKPMDQEDKLEKMGEVYKNKENERYGEYDQLFLRYDYDKNGSLSELEFSEAILYHMKMRPDKEKSLTELLNSLDLKSKSQISRDDFKKVMLAYVGDNIEGENIIEAFKCFDKNLRYKVGVNEIRHVFSKLGLNLSSDEAEELLREADINGNLEIDFEEFIKIMLSK